MAITDDLLCIFGDTQNFANNCTFLTLKYFRKKDLQFLKSP